MKPHNKKKVEHVKDGNEFFRVRIVEQCCSDARKLVNLMLVLNKYNLQLASYV
jgi:hypothetical protein